MSFSPTNPRQGGRRSQASQKPRTRSNLSSSLKLKLIGFLAVNPSIARLVADRLKPEHFVDESLSLVYRALDKVLRENGYETPDELTLQSAVRDLGTSLGTDSFVMMEAEEVSVPAVLRGKPAADAQTLRAVRVAVINCVTSLINEAVNRALMEKVASSSEEASLDMVSLYESLGREIRSINEVGAANEWSPSLGDDVPVEEDRTLVPTNLSFLDHYLGSEEVSPSTTETDVPEGSASRVTGNGMLAGEAYGLMGPSGSAKTTIAAMLAAESCKHWSRVVANTLNGGRTNEEPDILSNVRGDREGFESDVPSILQPQDLEGCDLPVTYFVSFEEPLESYRRRMIGYAGRIARVSMEPRMNLSNDLNANLRPPYDNENLSRWGTEVDRYRHITQLYRPFFQFIDFTGTDSSLGAGTTTDIARAIHNDLEQRARFYKAKTRPALIIVDYVKAMAYRVIAQQGGTMDDLRHHVNNIPKETLNQLAVPMSCPVWLLNQLTGEANTFASHKLPHHTDSSESKMFAESLAFSFQLSSFQRDENNPLTVLGCTKFRRAPQKGNRVIRNENWIYRVADVTNSFSVEKTGFRPIQAAAMATAVDMARDRRNTASQMVDDAAPE